MSLQHILIALLVTFMWGSGIVVSKIVLNDLPPMIMLAVRATLISLPVVPFLPTPKKSWKTVVFLGFFLGFTHSIFTVLPIEEGMSPGIISVLLQTQAFFTVLFAAFLIKERPQPHQILGMIIAFVGIILINLDHAGGKSNLWPTIMVILSALTLGVANLVLKESQSMKTTHLVVWSYLTVPIPLVILHCVMNKSVTCLATCLSGMTLATWGYLIYMAIVCVISYVMWGYLMKKNSTAVVAPFSMLAPMFAIFLSATALGHSFTPKILFACAVIMVGLGINQYALPRKKAGTSVDSSKEAEAKKEAA